MYRVTIDKTLVVQFYPETFLAVDIEPFHATLDTVFLQLATDVTFKFLRHGVKHTVVHALPQPQLAIKALHNLIGIVVTHRRRILTVRIERLETIAIVTVQAIGRTYPHHATRISIDTVYLRI